MSNLPVIHYLAEQLTAPGFQCEVIPCDSSSEQGKANLIATLAA